jgi:hypothetical protein
VLRRRQLEEHGSTASTPVGCLFGIWTGDAKPGEYVVDQLPGLDEAALTHNRLGHCGLGLPVGQRIGEIANPAQQNRIVLIAHGKRQVGQSLPPVTLPHYVDHPERRRPLSMTQKVSEKPGTLVCGHRTRAGHRQVERFVLYAHL